MRRSTPIGRPISRTVFDEEATRARAETYVEQARSFEEALDRARDFAAEEMFLIGLHLLSGRLDPDRAGRAYSALAQALVGAMLKRVEAAFAADHGLVRGGRVAVLAMGKLGSREMTAASDLDLILIYDFPADAGEFGRRASRSAPSVYYSRLTQRLLAALTAPTRRGTLYEVDMRLQALGPQGPARHPVLRLRPLPARRGRDLGAHGADARARHRRATRASRRDVAHGDPRHADAQARSRRGRARGARRCAR